MLRLSGLPQFLAVCSTRNLTAAAQLMGVSQPALTQAIAKLEKTLDVSLFDRSTRPLNLTAYGEALLHYARNLEHNSDELVARLEAMKSGTGGIVRVGCGPDWIHGVMPTAVARLQEESPGVRITLNVTLNDQLRADLDAGKIDMFFASISDVYFGPAYETRILLRESMQIVAAAGHPVHEGGAKALEDLTGLPWVMSGDETFGRQLLRRLFEREAVKLPLPSVETNSVPAMINIISHGQHLGFLSRTHIVASPELREVATLVELPPREGGVTWRRDAPLLPAAERLLAIVEEAIAGPARAAAVG